MKKMGMWKVIAEDTREVYRLYVPAVSAKDAREYVEESGLTVDTVIKEDREGTPIDYNMLHATLLRSGYGTMEISLIMRALERATDFVK